MLKSVRHFEPIIAQGLLARTTLSVLAGTPMDAPEPQIDDEDKVRQSILSELHDILRLSSEQNREKARSKILARLSDEINEFAARRLNFDAAEIRLGARGLLKPSQYRIRFADAFSKMFEAEFGIRRSHVERAVNAPDDAQHIIPTEFGMTPDAVPLSLFLRSFNSRHRGNEALLVVAVRNGRDLRVDQAWRIPGFIISRQNRLNAYAVLQDFVNEFGVEIPGFKLKLVFNASMVVNSAHDLPRTVQDFWRLLFGDVEPGSYTASFWYKGQQDPPTLEISMVYAIDRRRYLQTLNNR